MNSASRMRFGLMNAHPVSDSLRRAVRRAAPVREGAGASSRTGAVTAFIS